MKPSCRNPWHSLDDAVHWERQTGRISTKAKGNELIIFYRCIRGEAELIIVRLLYLGWLRVLGKIGLTIEGETDELEISLALVNRKNESSWD